MVLAFYARDNKLKPFSCKCDSTLDSFPWQSTEWPTSNRGKGTEPGELSQSPEERMKGAWKSICQPFRVITQLSTQGTRSTLGGEAEESRRRSLCCSPVY